MDKDNGKTRTLHLFYKLIVNPSLNGGVGDKGAVAL